MARIRSVFICQECGYESPKWLGRCSGCGQWNTMVEELVVPDGQRDKKVVSVTEKPSLLSEIDLKEGHRYSTGIDELDRVLGGGIVEGSLILVGGDPGIGKSTLLLQITNNIARHDRKVLYISGEESLKQIKLRANRLGVEAPDVYLLAETNLTIIRKQVKELKPKFLIIDSIQTVYNPELSPAPGSVTQVREATASIMNIAKNLGIAVFLVGHVTKQGAIAGPRVLEHMVDTVLYFEGEQHLVYRVLRSVKNRFGSTNEIGIFEMKEQGLVEVDNPSKALLSGRRLDVPGSVVICSMEGTRPVLVELQALTSDTSFGMPRRMATGVDYNRVILLMAVLEKRIGMALHDQDAYVNVVGGIKLSEPAVDLGIISAISSSFKNSPISKDVVVIGEVGLTGEVRAVNNINKRLNECVKMGFSTCVIPQDNIKEVEIENKDINIIGVMDVRQALDIILPQ
ncbi:MAG TPA: DNA repair protein RadA [Clostridiales bacterium]|nr:DNA repair protein RadA [Clostridiales bacterium]